jgi:hypothetical protein
MPLTLTVALFVSIPSVLLILIIERSAKRICGGAISWPRRYLIPLPIVLFLIANLDGVFSLLAYLETHPTAIPARYSENQAWDAERFFNLGIIAVAFLPFFLISKPYKSLGFIFLVWALHALWMLLSYFPLLLATGVPLQN